MTRQRLRPAYTADELATLYAKPHESRSHPDHVVRVAVTVALIEGTVGRIRHAADLSCGDGKILAGVPADFLTFGDYAPGWSVTGPLEQTLAGLEPVDLYVCCETLEHLDDPDLVLRMIRQKAAGLVLSTPVDAWGDSNPEHYWAWSRADVEEMLEEAGFGVRMFTALDFRPSGHDYCFGIWGCR